MTVTLSRPTTKDLAEAAGVSLATVDRVLNDRPNVSSRSKDRVQEAIKEIGFVRNLAAVNLAKNRTYRFRFIFPLAGDLYLREIIGHVEKAVADLKSDLTDIRYDQIDMHDPHGVAKFLTALETDTIDGIAIMSPESPQVRDAITRLHERGIQVVQFLSGQESSRHADYVGSDNCAAGATAGRLISKFAGGRTGKVMVVTDTMQSFNNIQRRLGFDNVLNSHRPVLEALPTIETHDDVERARKTISRQLQYEKELLAIYVMGSEARTSLTEITKRNANNSLIVVAHERTPYTEQALIDDQIDAVVAQNPGHTVRSTLRILRARCDNRPIVAEQEKIRIEVLLKENL